MNIIKLDTNKYKTYYYLKNLWSTSNNINFHLNSNTNIKQNVIKNNNLLEEYKDIINLIYGNLDFENFKILMKNNLELLRKFGYSKDISCYFNENSEQLKLEGSDEENINIIIKNISDKDIEIIYKYMKLSIISKKNIIKNYLKCNIIPHYKLDGEINNPENFRYTIVFHNIIKIIDRLWCIELINECKNNLPDKEIFKSNLISPDFSEIRKIADICTSNTENKVLMDIYKAFDSVEWDVLRKLFLINVSRKTNIEFSNKMLEKYLIILENKNAYINGLNINIKKGLPLGLPSSSIVFQFIIEEIILRWLNTNIIFQNSLKINIYVDDIYIYFLNFNNNPIQVIKSIINYFKIYKFKINKKKIKISKNICNNYYLDNIGGMVLNEKDLFLGIPFTRNIYLFGYLILQNFQQKYINKLDWNDIYNIIVNNKKSKNCVLGFFTFKLKILLGNYVNNKVILEFIKKYYLNNFNYLEQIKKFIY